MLEAKSNNPNMPIGEVAYRLCRNEPVVCDHNVLVAARAFLDSMGGYFGIGPTTVWIPENATITEDMRYTMSRSILRFDQLRQEDQYFIRAHTPMLPPSEQGEQHQQSQERRRG